VFTHLGDYFFPGVNLWNVFAIWDGGNALHGSLFGGAVGAYIGCRRHGIRFWSFADALAPAMLVAQSLGRFGNYFNHELFGLPTTFPWGLQIDATNAKFPSGLAAGTPSPSNRVQPRNPCGPRLSDEPQATPVTSHRPGG